MDREEQIDGKIISLSRFKLKRDPVHYRIDFTHDETGFWFVVHDVENNDSDRASIAADLRAAADSLLMGASSDDSGQE